MNYLTYLRNLVVFLIRGPFRRRKHPKISILIPFSSNDSVRVAAFEWVIRYWRAELPEAEIIVGKSRGRVFCKGEALNNAYKKAKGKVIAIIDADAYLPGEVINGCADRILEELEYDCHLWYVPYRRLYRLTRNITFSILESDPRHPLRIASPPPPEYVDGNGHKSRYGHRYAAMAAIFPREAMETLGCFDERFKGWGGEDVALLRALDTLWGKHKTTDNDILHLWHPFIGSNYITRKWEGQERGGANIELASEYNKATRHPCRMRALVDEGCEFSRKHN
jgi:hypothetical protein